MKLVDLSIMIPRKIHTEFSDGGTICCITQLYLYCLGDSFHSGNFKKIVIEISDKVELENTIEDLLDVIRIHRVFDFTKYSTLDKFGKKKMMLDTLHLGVLHTAKIFGWDLASLENAYQSCIHKKIEYKWQRDDKYFISPNKEYYASVYCELDSDKFVAVIIFYTKGKEEVYREVIIESHPCFVEPMGKMGWDKESTSTFILFSKDGKQKWQASLY